MQAGKLCSGAIFYPKVLYSDARVYAEMSYCYHESTL